MLVLNDPSFRPPAPSVQRPFIGLVRPVIVSAVFFMVVTGLAYPLMTTGVANLLFPDQAQGSLVVRNQQGVGSRLIGQYFSRPEYFHARPSMTMGPDPMSPSEAIDQPYNAGASGASNQGATSKKLFADVARRALAYVEENGLPTDASVPVDAVTASASGLDPHISIANAHIQAQRVAKARDVPVATVLGLVEQSASKPQFGLLGDPRVNVLDLNLALDAAAPAPRAGQ